MGCVKYLSSENFQLYGTRILEIILLFIGVPAQQVNSTFREGLRTTCPGDRLNFICETRDSDILAWSSDEYIGQSNLLEFTAIDDRGTLKSVYPNTTAILINTTREKNGVLVIKGGLSIIVLPSIDHQAGHSVTCINVGVGTRNVTTFYLAGRSKFVYVRIMILVLAHNKITICFGMHLCNPLHLYAYTHFVLQKIVMKQ